MILFEIRGCDTRKRIGHRVEDGIVLRRNRMWQRRENGFQWGRLEERKHVTADLAIIFSNSYSSIFY